MSQKFAALEDGHRAFIERQKLFFVATAAPSGRINLSPKGMPTMRVLGATRVAYLDSTGSGNETRAHILASPDQRLTLMFCAFDGEPMILRLYGRATSHLRGSPDYDERISQFEEVPGARQIIELDVDLVQTSCGMAVPLYDYKAERDNLNRYWLRHGLANLRKYWQKKNMQSLDGLPTGLQAELMLPEETPPRNP